LTGIVAAAVPVGSVVLYSDGDVEKLLAEEQGRLRWEDDRKRVYVRSTNPVVPVLVKRDFLSGRGYTQRVASGDPDQIHKRPVGSPVEFTLLRSKSDGTQSRRSWECVYQGESRQEVLGVKRDLDHYVCERFVIHRKLLNKLFRERREFSYSRDLGLVVDLKRKTRNKSSSKRLVAVFPPGKADYKNVSRAVRKIRKGN
jgi:hypothetical protein